MEFIIKFIGVLSVGMVATIVTMSFLPRIVNKAENKDKLIWLYPAMQSIPVAITIIFTLLFF